MAIGTDIVARKYLNPVAATPISVDIPASDKATISVLMGESAEVAVQDTDYTVTLNTSTYEDFTITPTASMRTKIDALVVLGDTDQIVVRRTLNYLSDMTAELAFFRQKIATEFDKTVFRFQQLQEQVSRCFSLSEVDLGSSAVFPPLNYLKGKYIAVSVDGDIIGSEGTTDTPVSAAMGSVVGAASIPEARTALGLGTMAVETAADYETTAHAASTYETQAHATSTFATQASLASAVPSQTGNSGKFLTTNGSATSWGDLPAFPVRAWANFTAGGTTVNASLNVSSVSRAAAGDYTVNFTSALPDANYGIMGITASSPGTSYNVSQHAGTNPTTTACRILVTQSWTGTISDPSTNKIYVGFLR